MNLSMLLFNEESLATSELATSEDSAAKPEDFKPSSYNCDETVDDLNEDSMDVASGADASSNRASSAASEMAPELERSAPVSERLAGELDGAVPTESERSIPELEKVVAEQTGVVGGLAQQRVVINGFNPMQPSEAFLQELAMNAGISSLYMPVFTEKRQHKTKREWRNIGTFTSEEAMNEVRKREKVSKRKTVVQINGTKVFYRCNNWRRTSCNYRMHAIIHGPSHFTLFASGEHDHTTKNPHYVPRTYTGSCMYDMAPCSSQQQVLNQLVANATANSSGFLEANDQENVFEAKREETANPANPPQMRLDAIVKTVNKPKNGISQPRKVFLVNEPVYQLSDGPNIAALLQVAAEMGHSFKFNSRSTREYCIESNKTDTKGKTLVFTDHGTYISVTERVNGCDQKSEDWKKADWQQFLYAVRGKCRAVLA